MKIVIATKNIGKLKEFKELISDEDIQLLDLSNFSEIGDIEETGNTFKDNAILKGEFVAKHTELIAVADDSGLEVDALQGQPGVLSARFAGAHGDDKANNAKLLTLMEQVPDEQRTARFHCAIAICLPSGENFTVEGICEGRIAWKEEGYQGFGYDPLFIPAGYHITMGQMSQEEKNKISHRSKAVAQAIDIINKLKKNK